MKIEERGGHKELNGSGNNLCPWWNSLDDYIFDILML